MGIIARDNTEEERVSFYTLEKLETLIRLCSLEKAPLYRQLNNIRFEWEAAEMYAFLMNYQPIPGYHSTPHTLAEQKRAIRYAADKDDYAEELHRKNKGTSGCD